MPGKADSQRMSQGCYASLGGCIALRLGLAHAIAGRRDVHDGGSLGERRGKELGEVERGSDSDTHGILELLVTARVDALHQRQGIVDEIVHVTMLRNDLLGELLQSLLVGNIAHKVVALLHVNHTDLRPSLPKLLRNATANTLCATSHDDYFIFEIFHTLLLMLPLINS